MTVNDIVIPAEPYRMDFDRGLFMRMYRSFYDNIGVNHGNTGLLINMQRYIGGSFIVPFDLSPDRCNGFHLHVPLEGKAKLNLEFALPLPHAVTCLVFATYDAELKIANNGLTPQVTLE
jgi:hypothetical protein